MNNIKIKANETLKDQHDVVRIVKNEEYTLLHEFDETCLIIDESKKEVNLGKEHFYELEED